MNENVKKAIAIQKRNEERIRNYFYGNIRNDSGIYTFVRTKKDGSVCVYVGQAKHLVSRLAQHFTEYDHIGLSLKEHKLYTENKEGGWSITFDYYPLDQLDDKERETIAHYKALDWELYNITDGGQCKGKADINKRKPSKTYTDGKIYGRNKVIEEIRNILDKGKIEVVLKDDSKSSINQLNKLKEIIYGNKTDSGTSEINS